MISPFPLPKSGNYIQIMALNQIDNTSTKLTIDESTNRIVGTIEKLIEKDKRSHPCPWLQP